MGFWDYLYNGVEYQTATEVGSKKRLKNAELHKMQPPTAFSEHDLDERQRRQDYEQHSYQQPKQEYYMRPEVKLSTDSMVNVNGIHMHYPQSYEEVQNIIDDLKKGYSVIADLHQVKDSAAQRILDFVSGAVYALDGNITKIRQSLYLLSPLTNSRNGKNE